MESLLKVVTEFADNAHADQKRKYTPDSYIVHPVRVMEILKEYTTDIAILFAALLHDVLEDTPVTKDEILIFLLSVTDRTTAERTINLVVELTDVYIKKDYPSLNRRRRKDLEIERISKVSADAQTIKYADIMDNCKEIRKYDPSFAKVFIRECKAQLKVMVKGNPELKQRAVEALD